MGLLYVVEKDRTDARMRKAPAQAHGASGHGGLHFEHLRRPSHSRALGDVPASGHADNRRSLASSSLGAVPGSAKRRPSGPADAMLPVTNQGEIPSTGPGSVCPRLDRAVSP